jgi:hypothetical protein
MKRRPSPARPSAVWWLRFVSNGWMRFSPLALAGVATFLLPANLAAQEGSSAALPAESSQARPFVSPKVETTPAKPVIEVPAKQAVPAKSATETTPESEPPMKIEVAEPPPSRPPPTMTEAASPKAPMPPKPSAIDELSEAGYLPGYRGYASFGLSPFSPLVGGLPSAITPSFMAPMPTTQWTFRFNGFFNASAQYSMNTRLQTSDGQSDTTIRTTPATIEEYASFVSTNTVPGHWVAMNLHYGNNDVTASVSLTTWNPSEASTYYQLGSENFINNAYLSFNIPPIIGKLRLSSKVGYFYNTYASLGQYNLGMYQNPIAAIVRGVGGTFTVEYDLTPTLVVIVEEGFMGDRKGKSPNGFGRANPNYNLDPFYPASYIQHLHAGIVRRGNWTIKGQLHHIFNFSQDDRAQVSVDNMVTRALDESYYKDARMHVFAAEMTASHSAFGLLAIAASRTDATNAYILKGVETFGGEGNQLTDRYLGDETGGTGTMNVVGFNYSTSLGKILAFPKSFDTSSPDLIIQAGGLLAHSNGANPLFDGRIRYKAGLDVMVTCFSWLSVAFRVDHVTPNSKDHSEDFQVVAPRLVFKSNWNSRENITLMYAKWLYGDHSHPEYSTVIPPRLDDQVFALSANIWW